MQKLLEACKGFWKVLEGSGRYARLHGHGHGGVEAQHDEVAALRARLHVLHLQMRANFGTYR